MHTILTRFSTRLLVRLISKWICFAHVSALLLSSCSGLLPSDRGVLGVGSDGGSDVPEPISLSLTVEPLFPENGANWNDYVQNDGPARHLADDDACSGTENGYWLCLNGGEFRKVTLANIQSCGDLTLTDDLGVFDWTCYAPGGGSDVYFYTTHLKNGKGLLDLLDATAFKDNFVSLTGSVGAQVYSGESAPMAWWSNPVKLLPDNSSTATLILDGTDDDGGVAGDGSDDVFAAGDILTYSSSRNTKGYNIGLDRLAVVSLSGATLTWNGAGNNCNSVDGTTVAPDYSFLFCSNKDYGWFEFNLDGNNQTANDGIAIIGGFGNRVHQSDISSVTLDAIYMGGGAKSNSVTDSHLHNTAESGIWLGYAGTADYNYFENVSIEFNYTGVGAISVWSASGNRFKDIRVAKAGYGVLIQGGANANNKFDGLKVSNSEGLMYGSGIGTVVTRAISNNNSSFAVALNDPHSTAAAGSSSIRIVGVTAYGNATAGATGSIALNTTKQGTIHNVAVFNSFREGVKVDSADTNTANTLGHIAVFNSNSPDIYVGSNPTNLKFTGNLLVNGSGGVNDCTVDVGGVGIVDSTCNPAGISDFTKRSLGSVTDSDVFVGSIGLDDAENNSDTNGSSTYPVLPMLFDWYEFESFWRSWGPNLSQGSWTSGTGYIMDWRLKGTATHIFNNTLNATSNNSTFIPGATCPVAVSGNAATSDQDSNTYLLNASELMFDGIGDDDALCESNEACLYNPNFGAYQGHGNLNECLFQDGTVSGVTLFGYEENGL